MGWEDLLSLKLIEMMEIEGTVIVDHGIQFTLQLYGAQFTLRIWNLMDNDGRTPLYRLEFQNTRGQKIDGFDIIGPSLDIRNVVHQIRSYAQGETNWRNWQWLLSDAFVDAGFRLNEKTESEADEHIFKILLSKGGINLYFEINYHIQDTTSLCTITNTSDRLHPIDDWVFEGEMSNPESLIQRVHAVFQTELVKESRASASISQQPNTMRLYDAIVELLIAVHTNKQSLNDQEVLELLKKAKKCFP